MDMIGLEVRWQSLLLIRRFLPSFNPVFYPNLATHVTEFTSTSPLFDLFGSAACRTKDKKSSLNFRFCLNAIRRFHHSKILLHHHFPYLVLTTQ